MRCASVLLLSVVVVIVNGASIFYPTTDEWGAFKLEYGKKYKSDEEDRFRMKIYAKNKQRVAEHNQRFEQKLVTFRMKLNKYADMLQDEFVHATTGFNLTQIKSNKMLYRKEGNKRGAFNFPPEKHVEYPAHVDWNEIGAVTEVKDQGDCGSCWAFSATGALEGQLYRKTGRLISLSEQNLIDCSRSYSNMGCDGGWKQNAFGYVMKNHGIDTEDSYPYEAVDNKCRYNPKKNAIRGMRVVKIVRIPKGDENKLMQAVATVGPVSVAVDASHKRHRFYSDGVHYDQKCDSSNLIHAMLVVGYGTDEFGEDYWLVKNSYGQDWGEQGYIKMARNRNNNCGIATSAFYPVLK